jgi:hypothetical protein
MPINHNEGQDLGDDSGREGVVRELSDKERLEMRNNIEKYEIESNPTLRPLCRQLSKKTLEQKSAAILFDVLQLHLQQSSVS